VYSLSPSLAVLYLASLPSSSALHPYLSSTLSFTRASTSCNFTADFLSPLL
jgi:hypothetical protein